MREVAEMKMFFGVTRQVWLKMSRNERLYLMKREMERVDSELKKYD